MSGPRRDGGVTGSVTTTLVLHGTPRVAGGAVLAPREAALCAWLHLEGPTPRAALAGRLWPASTEAQARANLRQALARLKRGAGALLVEREGTLALAPGVTVAPAAGARLLGTLEFDDAPPLAEWLAARREAEARERLREGLAAARARLEAGDLDTALAAADALLADDPAVEEAHRVRMEVFHLRGDRAAAVAAWDACRDALRSAFGVAPSAATNELGRLLLAQDAPAPPRRLPPALRRPPLLVGREALRHDLATALALGRSVLVAGIGGIGKSRLLSEAAGPVVAARPGDALVPGSTVARLLADALARHGSALEAPARDTIAALVPGQAAPAFGSVLDQRRWFAAVADAFDTCRAHGLRWLALDDLQFADDLSTAALQVACGAWLAHAPVLVGLRPDELRTPAQALVAMLEASGRALRLDLTPLAPADVRALLDTLDWPGDREALAAALLARVGGTPADLLEALKNLWLADAAAWQPGDPLPVPATLRDGVRQRLSRLPEGALQLAQLAALAGSDFSAELAAEALAVPLLDLAPRFAALEAAQVFDGGRFAHDLLTEAVARTLPAALAPALHRRLAEPLARGGAAPAAVAFHFDAAGDTAAAAPWHLRAAERARASWQMAEAGVAFEKAAAGAPDEAMQLHARLGAARCALWARRAEDAMAQLALAVPLAHSAADRARVQAQAMACDFNARRIGDAQRALPALLDAFEAEPAAFEPSELADGLRTATSLVAYGADLERVLACAARVQPRVDADPAARAALGVARGGLLHWAARPREALAELDAAWAATQPGRDAGTRVMLANQRLRVRHALGDLPGTRAEGEALLAAARPLAPGAVWLADVAHVVAMAEVAHGHAATGLARFDALLAELAAAGEAAPDLFVTSRALALIACGRLDEAAAELARHPPAGRDGHGLQDMGLQLTQARLAQRRGEDATGWLDAAAAARELPPGLQLQRAVALASMRPDPNAATLAATLARRGMAGLQRVAELAAARAALAAGHADAAVSHARAALALEAQVDAWVDEPAALWCGAAEVLAAAGRADEARVAAARGAAWVDAGSAQWADPAHRRAWRETHPLHRRLLAWPQQVASPP